MNTRLILVSFMLLGAAGCSPRNDYVLVIEKTRSYHTDVCGRVNMARTLSMTREEARARNCKPCPGCEPDAQQ